MAVKTNGGDTVTTSAKKTVKPTTQGKPAKPAKQVKQVKQVKPTSGACDASVVWGSPDYLKLRHDDVLEVRELSKKTKVGAEIRRFVRTLSTAKDNLAVHRTYEVFGDDGLGARRERVVWISLGLGGKGLQADYLAALKRLADTDRFYLFDAHIDACDDVADVLCCYYPETVAVRFGKTDTAEKSEKAETPKKACSGGCSKPCGKSCGKTCGGSNRKG